MERHINKLDLDALGSLYVGDLLADLRHAANQGLLVSVRVQDMDPDYDWVEPYGSLTGVWTMTPDEYRSYRASGGIWGYDTPEAVASDLGLTL